ncbi:MAG: hypothetical protein P4L53_07825 [Candidatus Obscuribacterales bacterium]|nr:hypothetical protein [Candidatus Obscuribacterales bacterium]
MSRPLNPWKLTGYKAGQNVVCKITNSEPGGYAVLIPKDNLPGFLPTQASLHPGEEILAQFVCVHNNRILLSARFGSNTGGAEIEDTADKWQEQMRQMDNPNAQPSPMQGGAPAAEAGAGVDNEPEQAFNVWAQGQATHFHVKRATDLILPPLNAETTKEFNIADYDVEWLITDLEGGMRTGCVKSSSEGKLSRSAMLLYRGRAVGCIHGCKTMPDTLPTEQSLHEMLTDFNLPDTKIMIYDLPDSVTLSMSALFLGYPVQRNDQYDTRTYMDYICEWFASKGQTACLAISLPSKQATCLVFIYNGAFVGAFYVKDQTFTQDQQFVYDLLKEDPGATIAVSILPAELTSAAVRFGFSLSMARTKRPDA